MEHFQCGTPYPYDNNSHGTHTMGTMAGDDGGASQIGVAPGARWIACAQRVMDPCENGSDVVSFAGNRSSFTHTYSCTEVGNDGIVASAADSQGASDSDTVTISIVDANVRQRPAIFSQM